MTIDEMKAEIQKLIRRAPNPKQIASVNAARAFKDAVDKAKKAKSTEALTTSLNILKGFYQ